MRYLLRFLGFAFTAGAVLFFIGAGVAGFVIWKFSQDLPDYTQLRNYQPPVMTRVYAADGSILAEYARERRIYVPIEAVPNLVKDAFISAEDKNFYNHHGVDPEGVIRAAIFYIRRSKGQKPQGASTITQQVAKNFLLSSEQTFSRKFKEMLLAIRIENAYSKDKILELYLNQIYLGMGNYGLAAAALNYFGKSVHELTIAEAAYLAALPKGPNNYNPFRDPDAAIARRNWVIDRMVENGYVSRADGEKAKKQPLGVTVRQLSPASYASGYFTEEVRREIAERYGEKKLYEGGLSVRTTLDPKMQAMARKALDDGLVRYDEAHGWHGLISHIDMKAGEWGAQLAKINAYDDVLPWRLAVVLEADARSARIGLRPFVDGAGRVERARQTGTITLDGMKWTRKGRPDKFLNVGDVVYAEPIKGRDGEYRLRQIPKISGAIVAMDPNTGRVYAMVGGFSFDESEFNRATQALRQPGSSFKPIVYAAALDNGYTPSTTILDAPVEIDQGPGVGIWRPENFEKNFAGPKPLRYAIEHSKNLMTVRLARDIGMPLIVEYAKRFGVYDDLPPLLSMSLGAGETTVLRMTTAYSMFVNGGKRITPTLVDFIQDRFGETIFRHDRRTCEGCDAKSWNNQPEPKLTDNREQVIDPLTAYQVVSILEGVVQRGTGVSIRAVGKPLAGKTGTTNDAKDVWFVGFSPDLAVGVYMGYDKPKSLGRTAQAAHYSAPVFRDFMEMALKDEPATPFRVPPGIKLVRVNVATGLRAQPGDKRTILEAFKPGTEPPQSLPAVSAADPNAGNPDAAGPDGQFAPPAAEPANGVGAGGLY